MELSNNLKKRFSKDFKLPINIFDEPYFSYFVELYDPVFHIHEKLNWLEKALSKTQNVDDFFNLGTSISKNIKQKIMATDAYQDFLNVDMNKVFPLVEQIKQQNIYILPNVGKELISIDLEKANFNCLNMFGLKQELGVKSYEQLMKNETDLEYYLNSKMIRQVIFGDLDPKRQQRVQKYIINQLCVELKKAGCELTSASSDEIIIKSEISVKDIQTILQDVDPKFKFFRVEKFKFDKINDEHDFFIKKTQTQSGEKLEFKNVPGHLFAQVYKQYLGQAVNSYDMLFYHEGFLAEFKEPLFKQELVNNTKPKM